MRLAPFGLCLALALAASPLRAGVLEDLKSSASSVRDTIQDVKDTKDEGKGVVTDAKDLADETKGDVGEPASPRSRKPAARTARPGQPRA